MRSPEKDPGPANYPDTHTGVMIYTYAEFYDKDRERRKLIRNMFDEGLEDSQVEQLKELEQECGDFVDEKYPLPGAP